METDTTVTLHDLAFTAFLQVNLLTLFLYGEESKMVIL